MSAGTFVDELDMTDLFCGAGGSSSGAIQIPGVTVKMAANHWRLAVETHNTNHPTTDHDCADISQTDPRRYPSTALLWASPECTNHSQARGKRVQDASPDVLFGDVLPEEAAERSRATMWDVCRFVEAMMVRGRPYKGFVVENVVDVRNWMFFGSWMAALRGAGYCLHEVFLNSMHAQAGGMPAPQSRDRWYCVGHLSKIRCPDLAKWTSPPAWCPNCDVMVAAVQTWKKEGGNGGRYRQQYVYRCPNAACGHMIVEPAWLPAAAAIDWSMRGQRIGDRSKPLAGKTLARIEAGLRKFARPITLEAAGNTFERRPGVRTWPIDAPLTTQTTSLTKAIATPPFLVRHYTPRGQLAQMSTPVTDVAPTQTASFIPWLIQPPMLVPVEGREGVQAADARRPARTQTGRAETALVVPLRTHGTAAPASDPLKTVVAGNTGMAFVVPLRQNNVAKDVVDPLDTVAAAGNHHALIMRNNGDADGSGWQCTDPDDVLRTLTGAGHQSLISWRHMVVDYNGPARTPGDPLTTQTTVQGEGLASLAVDVEDCEFRMLEPHEIKAAMAFGSDYVLLGNRREQVRLAGNAVTPPAARDLIGALAEAIHGRVA